MSYKTLRGSAAAQYRSLKKPRTSKRSHKYLVNQAVNYKGLIPKSLLNKLTQRERDYVFAQRGSKRKAPGRRGSYGRMSQKRKPVIRWDKETKDFMLVTTSPFVAINEGVVARVPDTKYRDFTLPTTYKGNAKFSWEGCDFIIAGLPNQWLGADVFGSFRLVGNPVDFSNNTMVQVVDFLLQQAVAQDNFTRRNKQQLNFLESRQLVTSLKVWDIGNNDQRSGLVVANVGRMDAFYNSIVEQYFAQGNDNDKNLWDQYGISLLSFVQPGSGGTSSLDYAALNAMLSRARNRSQEIPGEDGHRFPAQAGTTIRTKTSGSARPFRPAERVVFGDGPAPADTPDYPDNEGSILFAAEHAVDTAAPAYQWVEEGRHHYLILDCTAKYGGGAISILCFQDGSPISAVEHETYADYCDAGLMFVELEGVPLGRPFHVQYVSASENTVNGESDYIVSKSPTSPLFEKAIAVIDHADQIVKGHSFPSTLKKVFKGIGHAVTGTIHTAAGIAGDVAKIGAVAAPLMLL